MKTYEVANIRSAQSMGFYPAPSAADAVAACVREAGYQSVEDMQAELQQGCQLQASRVVLVPAAAYSDEDDSLAAAAEAYAELHGLHGWDLSPRWAGGREDSVRDTIVLSVPEEFVPECLPQTVTITNPFSGASVLRDISGTTQAQIDAYAMLMDEADLYELEGPESPAAWLAGMVEKLGPVEAGRIILGS